MTREYAIGSFFLPKFTDIPPAKERCQELWTPQEEVEEVSLLITGEPGTGKTSTFLCHLRRWNGPRLGYEDENVVFGSHRGQKYEFVGINGASTMEPLLNQVAEMTARDRMYDFTVVLIDELGELFHRGLEQKCRPLFEHPSIVVYATAQDFHSKKRKTDTEGEDKNRHRSILGQFRKKINTKKPTNEELARFIRERLKEFDIPFDGRR